MLNVEELMNELETGDSGKELTNYSGGTYICDAISEIADNSTSIYYSDIINFISENVETINDAIEEFGWDGCGSDLYKAGQMVEYCSIQNEIYKCLDDSMKYYALNYYEDLDIHNEKIDTSEISEDLWEEIENYCDDVDHNDTFSVIEEIIDNYIEKIMEEEEDE